MLTYIPAPWIRHGKHIEYSYSLKDLVLPAIYTVHQDAQEKNPSFDKLPRLRHEFGGKISSTDSSTKSCINIIGIYIYIYKYI